MGHFLSQDQLLDTLGPLRGKKKIVFTNGCFDILHVGHVRYLSESKAQGDVLVVGLNSDGSVRRLKGDERPVQPQEDRAEILAALESVDYVCLFDEDTPLNLIQAVKPDVLVKGGDWPIEKIVGSNYVMSYGGMVRPLQFVTGRSTSLIIEKIK